ncbi:lipopolysaccharide biosynthesis protein [Piscinibacter sp.]|uniref:lipopolysaccharide biosynthesis protein n=1 Tax=Piscinibacter sp. TaxID=1903157 RepID=UPI002F3EA82C
MTGSARSASASARHVLTLMTGTSLAQAIALAVSPILSRLYAPEQFGVFALYLSVVSLLAIAATGRYELAIVLPEADADAWDVCVLALLIAGAVSALTVVCVWAFGAPLAAWAGDPGIASWLYLVPIAVLLTSVTNTLGCWANRKQRYPQLAANRLSQSATTAAASVGFGAAGQTGLGLLWASVLGQALSALLFVGGLWRNERAVVQRPSRAALRTQARRYRNFPRINLPHALLDAAQASALLALLGLAFGSGVLGLYAFALRIVKTPLAILGSSVGQVFQQRAAQVFNQGGDLRGLVTRTTWRLAKLIAPFIVLMLFAPSLFGLVFGAAWHDAGVYALILAPWMALNFITSPLSQLPLIVGRQGRAFAYGLAYQASMLLPYALAYALRLEITTALALQSALSSVVLIFYGLWLHRLSELRAEDV